MAQSPARNNAKKNILGESKRGSNDGSSFFAAPTVSKTNDNISQPNQTQNLTQNQRQSNYTSNIPQPKRKPEDGSSFFAPQNSVNNTVPANDNQKNKVRPSDEVLAQQGRSEKDQQVPATQRGGAPVIQNPTAVSSETETTLSPSIAKLLNTQGQRQITKPQSGDFNSVNDNREMDDLKDNYPNTDFNQEEIIDQSYEDEEVQQEPEKINTVGFPLIMFIACIAEWLIVLVLSLMGTILGIILLPVGIAIEVALEAWKVIFGTFIFIWMTTYEKKHLNSFKSIYKNSKKLSRLKKPKVLGRRMFVGITIIPIVGDLVPLNAVAVYRTYSGVKKELEKLNA